MGLDIPDMGRVVGLDIPDMVSGIPDMVGGVDALPVCRVRLPAFPYVVPAIPVGLVGGGTLWVVTGVDPFCSKRS